MDHIIDKLKTNRVVKRILDSLIFVRRPELSEIEIAVIETTPRLSILGTFTGSVTLPLTIKIVVNAAPIAKTFARSFSLTAYDMF